MPRRPWIIGLSLLVVLLVGAEVALRRWQAPKARVQVINQTLSVLDQVDLEYDGSKFPLGRISVGGSSQVWMTAGPKGLLKVNFQQKGNSLKGYEYFGFDPMQNLEDSFKQVLIITPKQLEPFVEEDELVVTKASVLERVWKWIKSEFEPRK